MKTLCVAVVVLSLVSVCRPSSLACELMLQPIVHNPEVLGRWFVIALSSNYCWVTAMFNSVLAPSIQMDVTSAGKPHYYKVNFTLKVSEFCDSQTIQFFQKTNMAVEVRSINDVPATQKGAIVSSRCQDCLVIKEDGLVNMIVLLSRRPNVTSAEMKEFEVQADCLGMYRPQVLQADHDLENCRAMKSLETEAEFASDIPVRVKNMFTELFTCTTDKFLYYPRAIFGWAQQTLSSIW